MSTRKAVDRALLHADKRDRKRKTKMRVSGASVKIISRLITRGK